MLSADCNPYASGIGVSVDGMVFAGVHGCHVLMAVRARIGAHHVRDRLHALLGIAVVSAPVPVRTRETEYEPPRSLRADASPRVDKIRNFLAVVRKITEVGAFSVEPDEVRQDQSTVVTGRKLLPDVIEEALPQPLFSDVFGAFVRVLQVPHVLQQIPLEGPHFGLETIAAAGIAVKSREELTNSRHLPVRPPPEPVFSCES